MSSINDTQWILQSGKDETAKFHKIPYSFIIKRNNHAVLKDRLPRSYTDRNMAILHSWSGACRQQQRTLVLQKNHITQKNHYSHKASAPANNSAAAINKYRLYFTHDILYISTHIVLFCTVNEQQDSCHCCGTSSWTLTQRNHNGGGTTVCLLQCSQISQTENTHMHTSNNNHKISTESKLCETNLVSNSKNSFVSSKQLFILQ